MEIDTQAAAPEVTKPKVDEHTEALLGKKRNLFKYYAQEPVKKVKSEHKPLKLRPSITPGTILILLAGRDKGKRVVFLKQLPSGLLLITGPFKINNVPLRRVNQRYVIATSTKVDVSSVDVSSVEEKDVVQEKKPKKSQKSESEFFEGEKEDKPTVSDARKALQKSVDEALLPEIEGVPLLKEYLAAKFTLRSGQKPHELKF